jgi:hypothetical protein
MFHRHLTMAAPQSAAVISQSDNHKLVKVSPHVLSHPKMTVRNLQSHIHRSGPCNLVKQSPHAAKHQSKSREQQSSFTMKLSSVTAWRTIYLSTSKHPKMLQSGLRPCLHRSGPHGLTNYPPHVSPSSDDDSSAIFSGGFTK